MKVIKRRCGKLLPVTHHPVTVALFSKPIKKTAVKAAFYLTIYKCLFSWYQEIFNPLRTCALALALDLDLDLDLDLPAFNQI